jgi:hypothetical protein
LNPVNYARTGTIPDKSRDGPSQVPSRHQFGIGSNRCYVPKEDGNSTDKKELCQDTERDYYDAAPLATKRFLQLILDGQSIFVDGLFTDKEMPLPYNSKIRYELYGKEFRSNMNLVYCCGETPTTFCASRDIFTKTNKE